MLAFYRNALSPLMQPSCRYVPTCSNYSIESYKKFGEFRTLILHTCAACTHNKEHMLGCVVSRRLAGVWRGSVLTAWRLLRCSPLGTSGYDPPMWPPPGLGVLYGEGAWEYGPQVRVVCIFSVCRSVQFTYFSPEEARMQASHMTLFVRLCCV